MRKPEQVVTYRNETGYDVEIMGRLIKAGETFPGPEGMQFGDVAIRQVTTDKPKSKATSGQAEREEQTQ